MQTRVRLWDDTPKGNEWDVEAGWAGGLLGLSFRRFCRSYRYLGTQVKRSGKMLVSGPDGSVDMPPCRVVDAKGRRQWA